MITGGCNVLQPNEFPDTAEEGTGIHRTKSKYYGGRKEKYL